MYFLWLNLRGDFYLFLLFNWVVLEYK